MKKRKIVLIGGGFVGIAVLMGLGQMAIKLSPKEIPTTQEGLNASAERILSEKCIACHSTASSLPFYAKIPIIDKIVSDDYMQGIRHWDIADVSHLGEALKNTAPKITLGALNKLAKVLVDNSMPPSKYVALHWGDSLSESETTILNKWIVAERRAWLKQWKIEHGATETIQPIPDALPTDPAKVALGKALYNDTRLSKDNTISCASCHSLEKGGTDNERYSPGVNGQLGGVNAPTSFNAVFHMRQFWDGRAEDLQAQAGGPPLNPVEMASTDWNEVIAKLNKDAAFTTQFVAVYPEGYTGDTICNAIAEYEKTLITPNSPFDKFLKGDATALSPIQKKGYELFIENNCATCHSSIAMGGQSFEHMGLKADYFAERGNKTTDGDAGLAAFSKNEKDTGRFKVPTLRNIALTGPYLHDGSLTSLEEAVKAMSKYETGKPLTEKQVKLIAEFLRTLTGELDGKPLSPQTATK